MNKLIAIFAISIELFNCAGKLSSQQMDVRIKPLNLHGDAMPGVDLHLYNLTTKVDYYATSNTDGVASVSLSEGQYMIELRYRVVRDPLTGSGLKAKSNYTNINKHNGKDYSFPTERCSCIIDDVIITADDVSSINTAMAVIYASLTPQPSNTILQITVIDPMGAVVPNARILIRELDSKMEITKYSNPDGQLEFTLPASLYDVMIFHPGLKNIRKLIDLRDGTPREYTINLEAQEWNDVWGPETPNLESEITVYAPTIYFEELPIDQNQFKLKTIKIHRHRFLFFN